MCAADLDNHLQTGQGIKWGRCREARAQRKSNDKKIPIELLHTGAYYWYGSIELILILSPLDTTTNGLGRSNGYFFTCQ